MTWYVSTGEICSRFNILGVLDSMKVTSYIWITSVCDVASAIFIKFGSVLLFKLAPTSFVKSGSWTVILDSHFPYFMTDLDKIRYTDLHMKTLSKDKCHTFG